MRKKSVKTTAKSTEAITETAAKVKETVKAAAKKVEESAPAENCLLYTSPSPRDISGSRMPSSA